MPSVFMIRLRAFNTRFDGDAVGVNSEWSVEDNDDVGGTEGP